MCLHIYFQENGMTQTGNIERKKLEFKEALKIQKIKDRDLIGKEVKLIEKEIKFLKS